MKLKRIELELSVKDQVSEYTPDRILEIVRDITDHARGMGVEVSSASNSEVLIMDQFLEPKTSIVFIFS